jgi:hypothetical protein
MNDDDGPLGPQDQDLVRRYHQHNYPPGPGWEPVPWPALLRFWGTVGALYVVAGVLAYAGYLSCRGGPTP